MNKALPKVSIVTITYGHEKYITETLNGVLMQQYQGSVELIIANDNSPDATDEVVKKYFSENPAPENFEIKYTKHETNKGMMPNFIWALEQATGKYIAICEGDDYWTDPQKLQRQVDFLEKNTDYSTVAENCKVLDERHNQSYIFSDKINSYDVCIDEIVMGRKFHTASILFRNENLKMPANYRLFPFGDTLLFVVLAKAGKIIYLPNISLVYRRNEGGTSTGKNRYLWAQNVEKFNLLLNEYLEGKFKDIHWRNIYLNYYSGLKWSVKTCHIGLACKSLYKFLQYKK